MWLSLFILTTVLCLALLVFFRVRDNRYLKKSTRFALGKEMKKEIDEEKEAFVRHSRLFEKALSKAQSKKSPLPNEPAQSPAPSRSSAFVLKKD